MAENNDKSEHERRGFARVTSDMRCSLFMGLGTGASLLTALGLSLTLATPVSAEVITTTTLGGAGITNLQKRTGDAVQKICGAFIAAANPENPDVAPEMRTELQSDLFDKCGEMVHTANRINGSQGGEGEPPTSKDLGLNAEQLSAALQNVATEEAGAAGSMATKTLNSQSGNIGKRLSAILQGSSRLQISAANLQGFDSLFAADRLPASGGSAAADAADVTDGLGVNRWGLFANGLYGSASKDATDSEDGFDASASGFTLGADYRFGSDRVLGVALGFADSSTDFTESMNVAGGGLDSTTGTLSLYGLWFGERYYADAIVTAGTVDLDMQRRIVIGNTGQEQAPGQPNDGANRTASSSTSGSQVRASLSAGAEYRAGAITFAPYGRLSVLNVSIDGYDETGAGGLNLAVQDQDIDSVSTAIGYRVVGVTSTARSIISPQLSFEWVHEFSDDSREIVSTYIHDPRQLELLWVGDDPDRDYFSMGVGVSAVLQNRIQLYGDVKSLIGLDDLSETVATIGARFEL